jgi:mono/diheme cytochrome c family protein
MCVQCHSPRDARGELIQSELLRGAPMPAAWQDSPTPWVYAAPKLAGLPAGFTEASLIHFLQTGERTAGYQARPPMPPFRMNEADATAVVAYLKSLR